VRKVERKTGAEKVRKEEKHIESKRETARKNISWPRDRP